MIGKWIDRPQLVQQLLDAADFGCSALPLPQPLQTFLKCDGNCLSERFTRELGNFGGQGVSLFLFDIQSHEPPYGRIPFVFYHKCRLPPAKIGVLCSHRAQRIHLGMFGRSERLKA